LEAYQCKQEGGSYYGLMTQLFFNGGDAQTTATVTETTLTGTQTETTVTGTKTETTVTGTKTTTTTPIFFLFKTEYDAKVLEWRTSDDASIMGDWTSHMTEGATPATKLWARVDLRFQSAADRNKCFDHNTATAVGRVDACNNDASQRFEWNGTILEAQYDTTPTRCLDYFVAQGTVNIHSCNSHEWQQWFVVPRLGIQTLLDNKCLHHDPTTNRLTLATCDGSLNQRFRNVSGQIKYSYNALCAEYTGSQDGYLYPVNMVACNGGSNQQWYRDGDLFKSAYDNTKCMDYDSSTASANVWTCHSGNNQKWNELVMDY